MSRREPNHLALENRLHSRGENEETTKNVNENTQELPKNARKRRM